ncbi:rod shape-determining protein RodA [candidate division WWE3 bacterium]|nr:rod shape-determining protein RodA [candidate division WWE3 bacterium]
MPLKKFNLGLIIPPLLIFSLSFMTLYSVSPNHAKNQLLFFIIGVLFYLGLSIIDYSVLAQFWKPLYVTNLGLLILIFVLGQTISGSTRWFTFFGFSLQPSEFAKFTLILTLGALLSQKPQRLKSFKGVIQLSLLFIPFFFAVVIQPDLGTTLVLLATFLGVLFYAGLNKLYFLVGFFLAGISSSPLWSLLKDYQKERILVFLNPQLDNLGAGYNVVQSLIAVGSGGLFGKGFGQGSQSHLQFLPAYWTDFIFASFSEEWGFIGLVILLLFFTVLFGFILYTASKSKDLLGHALVIGVFITLFSQFFINVGMNLGIMPVTGIPLPFMTYGGSSLITNLAMLGLVQSVWVHSFQRV